MGMFLKRLLVLICVAILAACSTTASDSAPVGFYRVKAGDTLYRIAKNNGQSVATLKRWNQLQSNEIEVGQLLRVSNGASAPAGKPNPAATASAKPTPSPTTEPKVTLIWPHRGNVIQKYAPPRSKGIDIEGKEGDNIVAAADGKVVYAGDGIRAYGHMVIIRHEGDYLTTYAHNQTLLVAEGAQVKQGQPIAKMGSTGTDRVKLHFELRYKGQPINPMMMLP
ncbi:peptidoglycan DD-metalloendopeptidase family protein [Chitinibacter sp. S2-10]|uniref:peptidoglycan DD-metalloendopeptidase family protein n=1 Tax=Chitinibacter sp. S2-10 TaxID=3373597 RepID=UPI0039775118